MAYVIRINFKGGPGKSRSRSFRAGSNDRHHTDRAKAFDAAEKLSAALELAEISETEVVVVDISGRDEKEIWSDDPQGEGS